MEFIVKKQTDDSSFYKIVYLKKVKDIEGKEFTMADREETTTLEQLQLLRERIQSQLDEVDGEIKAIGDLK